MVALLFLLLAQVPAVIDGDLTIEMSHGRRSGDPVVTINDKEILHYGQGPNELQPHTLMYDWSTKTVFASSSFRAYWVRAGKVESETYRNVKYSSTAGVWGKYRIVFHHDFKRKRGAGGRVSLEANGTSVLIARQTAQQSMGFTTMRFYAGKNALIVIDNMNRGIGYLPLVDGEVETTKADGQLVPTNMTTFPMPFEFRERPLVFDPNKPDTNLMFADAMEIQPGLYYLCANDGRGYVYDLDNTSSYYLGYVPVEGCPVGIRDGKLLLDNPDDGLIEIDPLALVIN